MAHKVAVETPDGLIALRQFLKTSLLGVPPGLALEPQVCYGRACRLINRADVNDRTQGSLLLMPRKRESEPWDPGVAPSAPRLPGHFRSPERDAREDVLCGPH